MSQHILVVYVLYFRIKGTIEKHEGCIKGIHNDCISDVYYKPYI